MSNSSLVKYGSYDLEEAEREEAAGKGGGEFMKLKTGKNIMRFLPPALGKKSPFRIVWQHSITMPHSQKPIMFTCPQYEAKRPCPACDQAEKLKAAGDEASYKAAGKFFARRRVYANVIDRDDPETGVKIMAFGKQIHDALIELRKNEDWGGDFTHPEEGFDIVVNRKGTGMNDTEYKVAPRPKSPLGNLEWIDAQYDLDKYAKVLNPQQIRDLLMGKKDGGGGQQHDGPSGHRGAASGTIVDAQLESFDGDNVPF